MRTVEELRQLYAKSEENRRSAIILLGAVTTTQKQIGVLLAEAEAEETRLDQDLQAMAREHESRK